MKKQKKIVKKIPGIIKTEGYNLESYIDQIKYKLKKQDPIEYFTSNSKLHSHVKKLNETLSMELSLDNISEDLLNYLTQINISGVKLYTKSGNEFTLSPSGNFQSHALVGDGKSLESSDFSPGSNGTNMYKLQKTVSYQDLFGNVEETSNLFYSSGPSSEEHNSFTIEYIPTTGTSVKRTVSFSVDDLFVDPVTQDDNIQLGMEIDSITNTGVVLNTGSTYQYYKGDVDKQIPISVKLNTPGIGDTPNTYDVYINDTLIEGGLIIYNSALRNGYYFFTNEDGDKVLHSDDSVYELRSKWDSNDIVYMKSDGATGVVSSGGGSGGSGSKFYLVSSKTIDGVRWMVTKADSYNKRNVLKYTNSNKNTDETKATKDDWLTYIQKQWSNATIEGNTIHYRSSGDKYMRIRGSTGDRTLGEDDQNGDNFQFEAV
jgi:hypothetical protein